MRTGANSFAGPVLLLLIVSVGLCIGVALVSAGADNVFRDDNAVVLARQETLAAEAEAATAEQARLEAEAKAEEQRELTRQWEARANYERAAGERSQSEADAYTTRRMADAAHSAINRQGRMAELGTLRLTFFCVVLGAALILVSFLALDAKRGNERGDLGERTNE